MREINPPALVQQDVDLKALASKINAAHEACEDAMRQSVRHALDAGRLLAEAKKRVGHGGWQAWLDANVKVAKRTAQLYLKLARDWPKDEEKAQRVALLPLREAVAALKEADEGEPSQTESDGDLPTVLEPAPEDWPASMVLLREIAWEAFQATTPMVGDSDFNDCHVKVLEEAALPPELSQTLNSPEHLFDYVMIVFFACRAAVDCQRERTFRRLNKEIGDVTDLARAKELRDNAELTYLAETVPLAHLEQRFARQLQFVAADPAVQALRDHANV